MARKIEPYWQGELDSLCGIHAIINALPLLVPDMQKQDAQRLFRKLMKEIARRGAFKTLWRGMEPALLRDLLLLAVERVSRERSIAIEVSRPFAKRRVDLPGLVQSLKTNADGGGVAIAMLRAEAWHWTVVRQVTAKTIRLFDSDGIGCVRSGSCELKKGRKYRVNASETVLLRRLVQNNDAARRQR